jgi:hypothetical protein
MLRLIMFVLVWPCLAMAGERGWHLQGLVVEPIKLGRMMLTDFDDGAVNQGQIRTQAGQPAAIDQVNVGVPVMLGFGGVGCVLGPETRRALALIAPRTHGFTHAAGHFGQIAPSHRAAGWPISKAQQSRGDPTWRQSFPLSTRPNL